MKGHSHSSQGANFRETGKSRLRLILVLTCLFFVVEVLGGLWANSLALLSDAGHMLSDMFALGLSLFAFWLSAREPSPTKTYGYFRFEVVAAFINGVLLILIALWIFAEAWSRFRHPAAVKSLPMLFIAMAGLTVNLFGIHLLRKTGRENLNVRGALVHMIGDAAGSVGAITAAIVIWSTGWTIFDPLLSVVIAILIIYSAWRLLWDVVNILMQGVPPYIDLEHIRQEILTVDGVSGLCDLHVWSLTSQVDMLSGHVVVEDMGRSKEILQKLIGLINDKFGINHITLQLEDEEIGTCKLFL
ncbi:MAG: cation transporter [Desulfobacterales bacterium]|nr:cation transporter [Desulfobacterales bacterium]